MTSDPKTDRHREARAHETHLCQVCRAEWAALPDSGERSGLRKAAQAVSDWFGSGPQPGVVLDLRAALATTRDAQPAPENER